MELSKSLITLVIALCVTLSYSSSTQATSTTTTTPTTTTLAPPNAATDVSVSNPQTNSITVSWTTVAGVYYMVQYSNGTSAMYKDSLNTRTQTSPQTFSLPTPGAEYTVRVLAFSYMDSTLGGEGVESNNVTFTAVPSDVVPTRANPLRYKHHSRMDI
ncbi:hypothetical protein EB796_011156 [Bugula neritina]|uniref:Fibronectin type-III domain-containing protein n=1 Tax=Bugula neritina TaxID=10212 RepID=A0A7J7JX49_BUGNE|nr:hypothetical protein EB796_011156 [Bugula neritina]